MPAPQRRGGGAAAAATLGALTGGLLSSSCCVLQLLLNYTSLGCAGFSVLTPYRPYFRAVTGVLLTYLLCSTGLTRRTATTLVLAALLTASQDLLGAHNRGALAAALRRLLPPALLAGRAGAGPDVAPPPPAAVRTTLAVTGLRCEACAARLRGRLAAVPGVDGCTVAFGEGRVEVWSNATSSSSSASSSAGRLDTRLLLDAVAATDASYSARLLGQECFDAAQRPQPCPAEAAGGAGEAGSSEPPAA